MDSFLLASYDSELAESIRSNLSAQGFSCEHASTGKEAQALLYKKSFSTIILDLELADFSSLEVLKYIKLSKQSLKVMLYVADKKMLTELGLDDKKLTRLGILDVLHAPMSPQSFLKKIEQWTHATSWRQVKKTEAKEEKKEARILDRELTHIPIQEVLEHNIAIYDHYIKLASNKYVKVVNQGEPFPTSLIQNYANSGCEFLYFLTRDRVVYINYMNELTEKMIKRSTGGKQVVKAIRNVSEKYIEEIHTQGIKPHLVEEGKKICQNMYELISKDKDLYATLRTLEDLDPTAFSHSFLVSFYSMIICKNVDWIGPKALSTISLGCLFHDIGTLKLPVSIRESMGKNLSPKDLELYQQHTRLGAEMLQNSSLINEQVRQIVYQHHELLNGSGYPNNLTGLKIYPLAKIVSLADGYTELMIETKGSPRQVLKALLQNREEVVKYDANMLRALVNGIT